MAARKGPRYDHAAVQNLVLEALAAKPQTHSALVKELASLHADVTPSRLRDALHDLADEKKLTGQMAQVMTSRGHREAKVWQCTP